MDATIHDRHLINRYLQGELSGIELEAFSKRMNSEDAFKRQVDLQQIIYDGIRKAREDQLIQLIRDSINYRKPAIPWGLQLILSFLIITVLGVTLWFYLGIERSEDKQSRSWFTFLQKPSGSAIEKKDAGRPKQESKEKIPANHASPVPMEEQQLTGVDTVLSDERITPGNTDSSRQTNEEEIVVKEDQLLISVNIPITDKSDNGVDE